MTRRSTYCSSWGCGSDRARRRSTANELSISIDALALNFEPKGEFWRAVRALISVLGFKARFKQRAKSREVIYLVIVVVEVIVGVVVWLTI